MIRPLSVEWKNTTPLPHGAGSTAVIGVGFNNSPVNVADCRGLKFFMFSIITDTACEVIVDQGLDPYFLTPAPPGVVTFVNLFTRAVAASTYNDTYNLPGVLANNPGWITLQYPYVRISLHNTDVVNSQTYMRFYALAWG